MSDSLFQNSFYIGNAFNAILYGVELVLYVKTIQAILYLNAKHACTKMFFAIFSTTLLLLTTIFVAAQLVFGEEMWVVNAGFAGGSTAYLVAYASVWYRVMGITASIMLQLMVDALLICRCFILYDNFSVFIFPSVLWIATLVFGIIELYVSSVHSSDFSVGFVAHINITYAAISVGLNVFLSSVICARISRLLRAQHTAYRAGTAHETRYGGPIPVIVESALPCAVAGIAFLVSYGIGSGISVLFKSIYVMCACISSQMIIMRIIDGKAWERCANERTSAVELSHVDLDRGIANLGSDAKVSSEMQFSSPDPDLLHRLRQPRPSPF